MCQESLARHLGWKGKSVLSPSALCGAFSSVLGFCCYCHELANLLLVKRPRQDVCPRCGGTKLCPGLLTEEVSGSKEWLV